eukprot:1746813-Pyramimonas_sp.AAC.1
MRSSRDRRRPDELFAATEGGGMYVFMLNGALARGVDGSAQDDAGPIVERLITAPPSPIES